MIYAKKKNRKHLNHEAIGKKNIYVWFWFLRVMVLQNFPIARNENEKRSEKTTMVSYGYGVLI